MAAETYNISRDPAYYGSDATGEEAMEYAEIIAAKAAEEFPNVRFVLSEKRTDFLDEDLLAEVQKYINDNWTDWVA